MSHTAKINTEFRVENFEAFKRALREFQWVIQENCTARTYPYDEARNTIYPYVAINPESTGFDMGLKIAGDNIEVYGDFYGGSIARTLGTNLNNLRKEYAYQVIEEELVNNGYSVSRTVNEDATVEVYAE